MRGHFQQLGRNDYVEPARLSDENLSRIAQCRIAPLAKNTGAPWKSHEVIRSGHVIGFVTTRFEGQLYKPDLAQEWRFAASDWNRSDPMHGKAIVALLDALEAHEVGAVEQAVRSE